MPDQDYDSNNANQFSNAGAAYIYERNSSESTFTYVDKLSAASRTSSENFGTSAQLDGFDVIIGVRNDYEDEDELNDISFAGSAYIYSITPEDAAPTINSFTYTIVSTTSSSFTTNVNPNGPSTTVSFEYGTTSGNYSSTTSDLELAASLFASDAVILQTGLTGGQEYFYRAIASNTVGTVFSSEGTFTQNAEPVNHSTSFTVDNKGIDNIGLQFTSASDINADGYIILYKQAGSFTGSPTDETNYSVGSSIGDAIVGAIVTDDSAIKATISGLTKNLTYTFKIYPFNWDGANITSADYKVDGDVPNLTTQTIPTLGEIAMGSFIVLFAVGGVWYIRRQS